MAAVEPDEMEWAENRVPPSSSISLRRHFLHTYRRRRFRNAKSPDANCQFSHQFMSSNSSPNTDHHTCEQADFHDFDDHDHVAVNDTNDSLPRQSKNNLFEEIFKALKENEGGIAGCIKSAFEYHGKQSSIEKANHPLSEGLVPSNCSTNTELCQRAFSDIMASEEFASLCKLLSENFQGVKVDKLFDCNFIDRRFREGAYEHMPVLFPSDIHQFWKRLEGVGAGIVSLARSVSNRSNACYLQNGIIGQDTPWHEKQQAVEHAKFSIQGFDNHDKADHPDVLTEVGDKSDGKEFLICHLCKETYPLPCLERAFKGMSSRYGYCAKSIANGTGLPHDNCAVCKKIRSLEALTNGDCHKVTVMDEEISTDHEESSDSDMEERVCKICSIEIESTDKYQVCGHKFCQGRFFHERCLTIQQLKSHAYCWYCPSCLCRVCLINKDDDKIVLCDGCDHGYHIHCLNPPLSSIPKGKWFCASCKAGMLEISRVKKAYMSCFTMRKMDNGDCKGINGQSKKKQSSNDKDSSNKADGMDMLLTAANTLNKE